jgi:carbamate kinase
MASDKMLAVVAIGGNSLITDKDHLSIANTKPQR